MLYQATGADLYLYAITNSYNTSFNAFFMTRRFSIQRGVTPASLSSFATSIRRVVHQALRSSGTGSPIHVLVQLDVHDEVEDVDDVLALNIPAPLHPAGNTMRPTGRRLQHGQLSRNSSHWLMRTRILTHRALACRRIFSCASRACECDSLASDSVLSPKPSPCLSLSTASPCLISTASMDRITLTTITFQC